MQGKKWQTIMGVGLAALALTVTMGLAMPALTQAQTTTETPAGAQDNSSDTTTTAGRAGKLGDRAGKVGVSDEYLAEALGITTDELDTAQAAAQTAAIDKALADGLITQAQADALKNGTGLGRGRGGLSGLLRLGASNADIDMDALLADALGITTTELEAAQAKAFDAALADAVADGRLTQAQADLQKAQRALAQYVSDNDVYAQVVADAVADGALTQTQADALLAAQGTRGGFGGWHGFGGMRGGRH